MTVFDLKVTFRWAPGTDPLPQVAERRWPSARE